MSCARGIFKVAKKDLNDFTDGKINTIQCVSYDKMDGMGNAECVGLGQPSGWKSRDGRLWFPTLNGVTVIDPDHMKFNKKPPSVTIEKMVVDEVVIDLSEKNLNFFPGKEKFEFQYTALSFLIPERIFFKYKLEGFDKKWQDVGTRRVAYYTSIPPGQYSFKVIACNNDGVWNNTGTSIDFYLKSYFYQTWWFYLMIVFICILSGFGIYRLRVNQLKKREKKLEKLVTQRTHQLEDANQKLRQLATSDGLTGIANFRRFQEFYDSEWKRSVRSTHPISVILVDVDFFKLYNDTYGHQAGDKCLKKIAGILNSAAQRPGDLAARYGGEEFIMVLSDTDRDGTSYIAEKLRKEVENLKIIHETSDIGEYITISL